MAADPTKPFRLLFVCTGNTCRSPLAEVIARRSLAARRWDHVQVASAGLGAFDGAPASRGSLAAASRHGLDLEAHRSRRVTAEMAEAADLILTMSPTHLRALDEAGFGEKSAMITKVAAEQDPDGIPDSVTDPVGGTDEVYEETYLLLDTLVERVLKGLEPIVAP